MKNVFLILGGLFVIWVILRLTNMLQFYTLPTGSNEPAMKAGSYFFATNLIKPERLDFICFKHKEKGTRLGIWVFRLCGLPGDTVRIENGVLFVNGRNADEKLNLKFFYLIPANKLAELKLPPEDIRFGGVTPDSVIVALDKERAEKIKGKIILVDTPSGLGSEYFKDKNWSADFFGPYVVPEGHYFVLGDYRHNSMDSRFIGPIPEENVVGTIIGK